MTEVKTLKQRMKDIEREMEHLAKKNTQDKTEKHSSKNFIKSSPESSQGDKSGSELSKKFITKNHLFFERDSCLNNPNQTNLIPNARYKTVI